MKIIGTILIIICLAADVAIGAFLYRKAYGQDELVNGLTVTELINRPAVQYDYAAHKFGFTAPGNFLSDGGTASQGIIDFLYSVSNNKEDKINPSISVIVTMDRVMKEDFTSEQYKNLSKNDFPSNTDSQYVYKNGGVYVNKNGIKFLYDTVSLFNTEAGMRTTEKKYTFFHNGNMYDIVWVDNEEDFDGTVAEFDRLIDTVKTY